MNMNIIKNDTYIIINNFNYYSDNNMKKNILMFDLDDTIIKFNLKSDNCEILYSNTISKLNKLNKNNNIVIVSNQKQIKKPKLYELFIPSFTVR